MTLATIENAAHREQVLNQVAELPQRLLAALERRGYDRMDADMLAIAAFESGNVQRDARFIRVEEVVYGADASPTFHLHTMQSVISSLRDGSHSLVYAVSGNKQGVQLLMGARSLGAEQSRVPVSDYVSALCRNLRAAYPGITLGHRPLTNEQCEQAITGPIRQKRYLAAVTGVPSIKSTEQGGVWMQSIDRMVDALRGESYLLLVLAEPIPDARVLAMLERLRGLSADIHSLVRNSVSISQNRSESLGASHSQSTSIGVSLGAMLAPFFGPSITKVLGETLTSGTTQGAGMAVSRERIDKTAQFCEQVLEQLLGRLQNSRNVGFWNVGVYLTGDNPDAFLRAQSFARSLYTGQGTTFEPLRILDLTRARDIEAARTTLGNLWNLRLDPAGREFHPLGEDYQHLTTPLTTTELSILVSLPHREVPGLKVSPGVDFNLNPPSGQGDFELGSLLYRDEVLPIRIELSARSLTRHAFVTGLTGSGKTNTCLALLSDSYRRRGLNFLVIDPAKTEYRFLLNARGLGDDLMIFTLGDEMTVPFRLNPFEFARGFPLLSHIDLIKAVFNAAFPMVASMPYLLEKAILAIYEDRGWDVTSSTHRLVDITDPNVDYAPYLPCLGDLYAKIDGVVASEGYDTRLRLDLTAALKARLGSLLRGGKGLMLNTQRSTPLDLLLQRPVVLELRRVSDDDEKAFVMALLFTSLYELAQQRPPTGQLQHVTLMEEAHRLLRNVPMTVSAESANPRGKAIEMFADMMAEMRTYGEGFIIVDQTPGKLIPDVVKGSNLKIVHRLLAQDDRQAVGSAMGLTLAQMEYLPRLTVGKAVIHSEELEDACLVKIDPVEDELADRLAGQPPEGQENSTLEILGERSREFYSAHPGVLDRFSDQSHPLHEAIPTTQTGTSDSAEVTRADSGELLTLLLAAPMQTCSFCKALHVTRQCRYGTFVRRRILGNEAFAEETRGALQEALETQPAGKLWSGIRALGATILPYVRDRSPEEQGGVSYCVLAHLIDTIIREYKAAPERGDLETLARRGRGVLQQFADRYRQV